MVGIKGKQQERWRGTGYATFLQPQIIKAKEKMTSSKNEKCLKIPGARIFGNFMIRFLFFGVQFN